MGYWGDADPSMLCADFCEVNVSDLVVGRFAQHWRGCLQQLPRQAKRTYFKLILTRLGRMYCSIAFSKAPTTKSTPPTLAACTVQLLFSKAPTTISTPPTQPLRWRTRWLERVLLWLFHLLGSATSVHLAYFFGFADNHPAALPNTIFLLQKALPQPGELFGWLFYSKRKNLSFF